MCTRCKLGSVAGSGFGLYRMFSPCKYYTWGTGSPAPVHKALTVTGCADPVSKAPHQPDWGELRRAYTYGH